MMLLPNSLKYSDLYIKRSLRYALEEIKVSIKCNDILIFY